MAIFGQLASRLIVRRPPQSVLDIAGLIDVSEIGRLEPLDFHYDRDSARVSVDVGAHKGLKASLPASVSAPHR